MAQLPGMGGGGQMPPQQQQQQQPPQGQITPGQSNVGGDINKLLEVLGMAIQQTKDEQGFVDVQQLIAMWPQLAQQAGLNIPFQTVWQMIQQQPELLNELVVRYGLSGIMANGRRITAEQLAGMGSGAMGGMR